MLLILLIVLVVYTSINLNTQSGREEINSVAVVAVLYSLYVSILSYDISLNNINLLNSYFTLNVVSWSLGIVVYLSLLLFIIYTGKAPLLFIFNIISVISLIRVSDLLALFVLVELQSYSFYLLTNDGSRTGSLASIIYFAVGSLGTVLLLCGISDIYNETGTISLISSNYPLLGVILIVIGIALKTGIAPLQNWSLEVYWLSSTSITTWLSLIGKLSFNGLLYILICTFNINNDQLIILLPVIAITSIMVGALGGLGEPSIKLALGYSGVATLGYALAFIIDSSPEYSIALCLYWGQYAINHLLIFFTVLGCGTYLLDKGLKNYSRLSINSSVEFISQIKGLCHNNILYGSAILISLYSLIGIPPLPGFYAKVTALEPLAANGHTFASVLLLVSSGLSAVYYAHISRQVAGFDSTPSIPYYENNNSINIYQSTTVALLLLSLLVLGLEYDSIYEWIVTCTHTI